MDTIVLFCARNVLLLQEILMALDKIKDDTQSFSDTGFVGDNGDPEIWPGILIYCGHRTQYVISQFLI